MIKIIKNGNPEKQFISDLVCLAACHDCCCQFQFEPLDFTVVDGSAQIRCPYCKNIQMFSKDDIELEENKKECSI